MQSETGPVAACTLLIASERLLGVWSQHAARAEAVVAVGDSDRSYVLEVIRAKQPREVVLEHTLADSPRGAPLMTALREERRLRNVTIRLLSPERVAALASSHPGYSDPQIWLTAFAHPLPPRPAQRARRLPVSGKGEVLIDGHAATAIDLSPLGAQVRSAQALRPNSYIRITLGAPQRSVALTAKVVWSVFELAPAPSYRAGLAFEDPMPRRLHSELAAAERLAE
jgi:hypothetical protein